MVKPGYAKFLIYFALGLFAQSLARGQTKLDIDDIIKKFLEKGEHDSAHISDNYSHEEVETVEHLEDGIVKKKETKIFFVEKNKGLIYKKLLYKDGVAVRNSRPEPKKESIAINSRLFERYDFQFARDELSGKIKYRVFSFRPKQDFPEREKGDRVLNNLEGEIWIADRDLRFKTLSAHMVREVTYAAPWVMGGKIEKMDANLQTLVIDGCFAINSIRIEVKYAAKAVFWPINGHLIITVHYQNYQKRR